MNFEMNDIFYYRQMYLTPVRKKTTQGTNVFQITALTQKRRIALFEQH